MPWTLFLLSFSVTPFYIFPVKDGPKTNLISVKLSEEVSLRYVIKTQGFWKWAKCKGNPRARFGLRLKLYLTSEAVWVHVHICLCTTCTYLCLCVCLHLHLIARDLIYLDTEIMFAFSFSQPWWAVTKLGLTAPVHQAGWAPLPSLCPVLPRPRC